MLFHDFVLQILLDQWLYDWLGVDDRAEVVLNWETIVLDIVFLYVHIDPPERQLY